MRTLTLLLASCLLVGVAQARQGQGHPANFPFGGAVTGGATVVHVRPLDHVVWGDNPTKYKCEAWEFKNTSGTADFWIQVANKSDRATGDPVPLVIGSYVNNQWRIGPGETLYVEDMRITRFELGSADGAAVCEYKATCYVP